MGSATVLYIKSYCVDTVEVNTVSNPALLSQIF
jgi:hypothetical protein